MDTKKLRQKILDLAIRGKLVPQNPNDEPASALLGRIRAEKEHLIKEGKIKRSKKSASDKHHYENEAPFELPENWEWTTINDICSKIGSGSTPRGSNYAEIGIPFFRSQNVYNDGLVYDDIKYISDEVHESMIGTEVQAEDLLLNITGGSLGRCAIVPSDFPKGNVSQHVCILRTIVVLPAYLHLFIISDYFASTMILSGSGREGLPKYSLEIMQFPLPPLTEQHRIVAAVEKWFSLIDKIEIEKEDLQTSITQAKSKILELAIHGKLVPQDLNDEPAIDLLKRINPKFVPCDNAHDNNQLPDSWCWTTLGSIFQHNTGKALNKSDSQEGQLKPYLTTSNVYWNCFDFTEVKEMFFKDSELEKCTITKGDLLVCEGGDIGRASIWNYDYDICIQNHIHRLRTKGDICQILYLYILMLYKWKNRIRGKGIGLQGLSSGLLDKLVVPLPPYNEQLRIVTKIEELFAVLDEIQKSIEA